MTTLGDFRASREIVRARAADVVKHKIRDVVNNAIICGKGGDPSKNLGIMIRTGLEVLLRQNVINSYNLDQIEVTPHKPFREVNYLPITAKPGDPLIVEHINDEGFSVEMYRGIIISTDGRGHGVVFSQPTDVDKEGQVSVRCSIRPTAAIDSIVIEVKQDY